MSHTSPCPVRVVLVALGSSAFQGSIKASTDENIGALRVWEGFIDDPLSAPGRVKLCSRRS
ncbi:hypothetical protein L210DRAFT_2619178 [Boletus edulis BED1]|uniref:Uncharacterized protein n=1 Tax=Boletus edulis BED1 TaxID=1328754 RepID=A0AAD4C413_BOLED|nr:hypothetical protein L210DRAFT_2619178 [Boletus edulis BED1]